MKSYIWISFAFMAFAYYELSGGSDFEPEARPAETLTHAKVGENAEDDTTPQILNASFSESEPVDATASLASSEVAVSNIDADSQTDEPLQAESLAVEEDVAAAATIDTRYVAGSRVNMRQGPGTNFAVITTLNEGTEVEVLEVNADGWAKLNVVSTGQEGWMAERLLTDPA